MLFIKDGLAVLSNRQAQQDFAAFQELANSCDDIKFPREQNSALKT